MIRVRKSAGSPPHGSAKQRPAKNRLAKSQPGKASQGARGAEPDIWREVAKTVAPLPPKVKRRKARLTGAEIAAAAQKPAAVKPAGEAAAAKKPATVAPPAPKPLPPVTPQSAPGLDARSFERLRRGQYPIERRLDLHGHTLEEAHEALADFLGDAQAQGKRCVIVITGKGSVRREAEPFGVMHRGTLREKVPLWLNEPKNRARILAVAGAQPKHGGMGALYVLLKKLRA
ncbi:MAG: Smr/MutS family protein [Alphaproteobacteria bacterium]